MPAIELIAFKMMRQSISRCDSIHLLLTDGLLEDATILLRSLMWDAQRLIYLDQNSNDRVALLFGMGYQSIQNLEDLASKAEANGLDAAVIRSAVVKQRQMIGEAIAAHGGVKRKKFPKEGAGLAKSIRRPTDTLGHQMYSATAHSAALSIFTNVSISEDGKVNLSSRNKSPGYVSGIAWSAIEHMFEGVIATAKAQEWDTLDKLREQYAETSAKFKCLCERQEEPE